MATQFARDVADYMLKRISDKDFPVPLHWDPQFIKDLDHAAYAVKEGKLNIIAVDWDAEALRKATPAFKKGTSRRREEHLAKDFPPLPHQHITEPTIVTDCRGRILLWYIPDALTEELKAAIWALCEALPYALPRTSSWRQALELFRKAGGSHRRAGTIDVAPVSFMRGHNSTHIPTKMQPRKGRMATWASDMFKPLAVLGSLVKVVQPHQFEVTLESLDNMYKSRNIVGNIDRLREILRTWVVPFHGISLMSNRNTPRHRDSNGLENAMDLLLALGESEDGVFRTPTLGLSFAYKPGCIIMLAGHLISHEADVEGDRICLALYTRKRVHKRLRGKALKWAVLRD